MHTHSEIERERYGFRSVRLLVWRCIVIVTQLPRCQLMLLFLLFTLAHTRLCHTTVKSSWIEREAQTYRYIAHHRRIIVCACWMCRNTRNKKQAAQAIAALYNVFAMFCESVRPFQMFGELSECRYAVIQWNNIHWTVPSALCWYVRVFVCAKRCSLSQSVPLFVAAELLCACYTLNAIRWLLLLLLLLLLANSSSSFRLRAVWFSLSYVAVSIQQHHTLSCYLLFKQYIRSFELYDNMILT